MAEATSPPSDALLLRARGSSVMPTTGQEEGHQGKGPLVPSREQKFSPEKVLPGKKLRFKEGSALGLGHVVVRAPRASTQSRVLPRAHSRP